MRPLGWILAGALAVSLGIAAWAWFQSGSPNADFVWYTAILCTSVLALVLGIVEHLERKKKTK